MKTFAQKSTDLDEYLIIAGIVYGKRLKIVKITFRITDAFIEPHDVFGLGG